MSGDALGSVVAIVQARMGSTRLPGKVLEPVGPSPVLGHVVERAACASQVETVVVATSDRPGDDAVADWATSHDATLYRGSEADVLDRYREAASRFDADVVVRITADCPLLSPATVDRVIHAYRQTGGDYASNTLRYTYPDGLDVEVFSRALLERTWQEADAAADREHVTPYMQRLGDITRTNVRNPLDTTQYTWFGTDPVPRWTVDYPEDLQFVRAVYDALAGERHWVFDQQAVCELLDREPSLRAINAEHR